MGLTMMHVHFRNTGVMISGYSRQTAILQNEFHLVGENAIVSWGYTADFPGVERAVPIPATQGMLCTSFAVQSS